MFRKDPFDYDENGFYATLLDLHKREIINIETKDRLKIKLLKKPEILKDEYEIKVFEFLERYSEGSVFDTKAFEEKIEALRAAIISGDSGAKSELNLIRDGMNDLRKVPEKKIAGEFVMSGKKYAWMVFGLFFFVALATISLSMYLSLDAGVYTSLILLVQSVPSLFVSSALFGKWKENYYKEKLEWDAFKTFLSDFTLIKKYATEDVAMWQEWLVYATALGVGDRVAKTMKELNIQIPEVNVVTDMPAYFRETYDRTSPPSPPLTRDGWDSGGDGGSGGGFGGDGGFGGGGGGAR
ncbi:MAG TPA: DUF2207 domain-containing protein [Candidatus Methanoperedenaceae archaeon]|nr:DUF2207 domain-containing protein [Candidatus Methanoperedenaceae archaeon]